jgi:hypothetical protein
MCAAGKVLFVSVRGGAWQLPSPRHVQASRRHPDLCCRQYDTSDGNYITIRRQGRRLVTTRPLGSASADRVSLRAFGIGSSAMREHGKGCSVHVGARIETCSGRVTSSLWWMFGVMEVSSHLISTVTFDATLLPLFLGVRHVICSIGCSLPLQTICFVAFSDVLPDILVFLQQYMEITLKFRNVR